VHNRNSENYSSQWHKSRNSSNSQNTFNSASEWKEASDTPDEVAGNFDNFHISEQTVSKLRGMGLSILLIVFDLVCHMAIRQVLVYQYMCID